MQMRPTDLNIAGAVDLSSLRPPAAPQSVGQESTSQYVFDVTEQTFEDDVLRRSLQVPVLIDFWAEWCGPCKQLSPVLERLAAEANGAWVLAKMDVDRNQAIAAQLQIQSIPTVHVAVGGRLVPGFSGALPEQQLRQFLDQVLALAEQAGLTGAAQGAAEPPQPPADPDLLAAEDALAREDYDAALAGYEAVLNKKPGDAEATAGRAWTQLLQRAAHLDPDEAVRAAEATPDDVDAQTAAADAEVLADRIDAAIDRLVGVVRRTSGDERERVRVHLLGLLDALDPADPRVVAGRRSLANALF